ncbi:MAG TPA: hypothetical protein VN366_00905 [Feifaniaceae bacterium]|nr:hypothetical protein [Feifaniaceae bacterium]
MNARRRKGFLIAAGALLLIAAAWSLLLSGGAGAQLAGTLNAYGYSLTADDIYPAGAWEDTSVAALLSGAELDAAISASKETGFPSDVNKTGDVTLVMANAGGDDVITLYLVNGEIELAFVQVTGSDAVKALGT